MSGPLWPRSVDIPYFLVYSRWITTSPTSAHLCSTFYDDNISLFIFVQIFLKTENGHNSMDMNQRYVNWYWNVMQIPFTIFRPYLVNEYTIGLYIMNKVCVRKPLSKHFFSFTFTIKTKLWILSCACFLLNICIIKIFYFHRLHPPYTSEYKRKPF